MAAADMVRSVLGRPDPRTPRQIDRDIGDEIDFHLACLEQELIDTGTSPDEASAAAILRFGDPQRIRRECERIAREDQLMIQKINLVLMIIVIVFVAAVGVQVLTTQRYNTLALQAITADLARMKFETGDEQRSTGPVVTDDGVVYVDGMVKNPGVYNLAPGSSVTLSRMLTAAGGVRSAGATVTVFRRRGDVQQKMLDAVLASELFGTESDIVLEANDLVRVTSLPRLPGGGFGTAVDERARLTPGTWHQLDVEGAVIDGGASLTLLDSEDVNNLKGVPTGLLDIPALGLTLDVSFNKSTAQNLHLTPVKGFGDVGGIWQGRWVLDANDVLALNLGGVLPDGHEPLRLALAQR